MSDESRYPTVRVDCHGEFSEVYLLRGAQDALLAPTWQPIETAPRDETDVMLYLKGGVTVIASWEQATSNWWGDCCGTYGGAQPTDLQPTHWMPLPPPPRA